MSRKNLSGYFGPPPMVCFCCGSKESQSGCLRGFTCGCTWDSCRRCHKCKKHCTCTIKEETVTELERLVTDACYLLNLETDNQISREEYEQWRNRWLKEAGACLMEKQK